MGAGSTAEPSREFGSSEISIRTPVLREILRPAGENAGLRDDAKRTQSARAIALLR